MLFVFYVYWRMLFKYPLNAFFTLPIMEKKISNWTYILDGSSEHSKKSEFEFQPQSGLILFLKNDYCYRVWKLVLMRIANCVHCDWEGGIVNKQCQIHCAYLQINLNVCYLIAPSSCVMVPCLVRSLWRFVWQ